MPTEDEKATTGRHSPFAPHQDTRKEKMEEAESNTLASLPSGAMSILEAIAVELPDVFAVELLPVDLLDTLSLAQVSKRCRDAVWSADGVQSLQAKITRLPAWTRYSRCYGGDAMACAIAFNNLPAIRALLKSGREVEGKIFELDERSAYPYWICYTPLVFATYFGHLGAVRVLIEAGADINKHAAYPKRSALWMACDHDRPDIVMQLIKAGADVNTKSISDGTSALVMAVGRGYEACVALLINAGADVSRER